MRGMVPEDVYELTSVSDPRLSPDGRRVAFVVTGIDAEANLYRSTIWVANPDGPGQEPPRQLTSGPKLDVAPRWSPDGSQLAFASNRERDAAQLYVLPVDGGEARRLTDLKEEVAQVTWSPDGSRLAFVSRVRDEAYAEEDAKKRAPRRITRLRYKFDNVGWTYDRPQHVFVVTADGSGEPAQFTGGEYEDEFPGWSPDGSRIVFASARHKDWDIDARNDLYVVDAARQGAAGDDEIERLTATDGGCFGPSWSPDGSRIAYAYYPGAFDDPRHSQIAVLDLATRERRILTASLDRTCWPYPPVREPIWLEGDRILFAAEDGGSDHLYRVAADGGSAPELVRGGEMSVTGYDAAAGRLVHSASTPTSLAELFEGGRRITDTGAAFGAGREIVAPERFTALSADGVEVEAWLLRPAGFDETKKYPMLLPIHGGPFTQWGGGFLDELQVYAGAGHAIVYCNPRGSSGYSEQWGRAIRGPVVDGDGWGSVDYQDLMAVVDEAIKRFDFVDPDRLGVMGGSYGGFMTSWIVGHTDRFRTAISERAVNSLISMWGSSDIGWDFKGYMGAFLFEAPDAYAQMSPLTYAKDIRTPLLILHSENDLRCPVEQGEQLFVTLRLLGREVEFVRFPEETHELSRSGSPRHRVQRFEVILEWLGRHLGGGGLS